MYKLFLCIRYLTRKAIVIFPILVVWLCVMMLIIVNSIMGGFVERVRQAGRGLMGDVVVESRTMAGFPRYQELQEAIQTIPEVEASTPVIRAYGLFNLPRRGNKGVQILGIDPAGKAAVSNFRTSLFMQYTAPKNAAEDLAKTGLPATGEELRQRAFKHYEQALRDADALDAKNIKRRSDAIGGTGPRLTERQRQVMADNEDQASLAVDRAYRTLQLAKKLGPAQSYANQRELEAALIPQKPSFDVPEAVNAAATQAGDDPSDGCIVGVDVGLFKRDKRGNYHRDTRDDFLKCILTVVPVTTRSNVSQPKTGTFVLVDDSDTKMFDVDSNTVYAPFKAIQEMTLMHEQQKVGGGVQPARCSELQIKVRNSDDPETLLRVRRQIQEKLATLQQKYEDLSFVPVSVQTWDEVNAKYLDAVRNEKNMMTFILGLMSWVVVVVIFLIFYMLVRDKTKDIGIIRAVGGSPRGIMVIFTWYGRLIGAIGGLLGIVSGVLFVWHTNEIHEWLFQTFGWRIWDRSVYLFDRIPDTVNWAEVMAFFVSAIVSGYLGALIPAWLASRKNPVEALRYE